MRKYLALLFVASIVLTSVVIASASTGTVSSPLLETNLKFNAPTYTWHGYVPVDGYLTTASGAGIGNAKIHAQRLEGRDVWTTLFNVTTDAKGHFSFAVMPRSAPPGANYVIVNYYRVTYDGDSRYAPSISNEVEMNVSW
jgi:hypothetical protein